MLDYDLAEIYGYEVKRLNEQVKRNIARFPEDFMFQLNREEIPEGFSKSQIATLNENVDKRGTNIKKLPYAFTEQGIYMLATVLRGELAEQQSIFIMRAFREMRHYIKQNQQFVTQSEMRLVTAKVSEISVQVAGVVDWKNKAEERFDSIQRSIDTLNENFVSENRDARVTTDAELFASAPEVKEPKQEEPREQSGSLLTNVMSAFTGKETPKQQREFNPNDYPVVYGSVRVINADTFEMYGSYFRLFGVDAPESNQTCADRQGRSYNCGREAARWLRNWIEDNELECHVIKQDTKGNMIGTCAYGQYDIGAALVNAGWAVADTKYTDAYYPYEIQAQENRRGLWKGTFYRPADWRKM